MAAKNKSYLILTDTEQHNIKEHLYVILEHYERCWPLSSTRLPEGRNSYRYAESARCKLFSEHIVQFN